MLKHGYAHRYVWWVCMVDCAHLESAVPTLNEKLFIFIILYIGFVLDCPTKVPALL